MSFFNNKTIKKWIKKVKKPVYILPPELNQIIMEFADGYPGMKRKLKNIHEDIIDLNYLHVYTIMGTVERPIVFIDRVWGEHVYDMIHDDMDDAEDAENWYAFDQLAEVYEQVNLRKIKNIANTPANNISWKTGPFLN